MLDKIFELILSLMLCVFAVPIFYGVVFPIYYIGHNMFILSSVIAIIVPMFCIALLILDAIKAIEFSSAGFVVTVILLIAWPWIAGVGFIINFPASFYELPNLLPSVGVAYIGCLAVVNSIKLTYIIDKLSNR